MHLFYCTLKIDVKLIYYLESVSFNSHRPRDYSSTTWTDVYNSLRHLAHAELGQLDKSNRSTCQNILTHKTIKTTGNLKVQYLGVLGVCYFKIHFFVGFNKYVYIVCLLLYKQHVCTGLCANNSYNQITLVALFLQCYCKGFVKILA